MLLYSRETERCIFLIATLFPLDIVFYTKTMDTFDTLV